MNRAYLSAYTYGALGYYKFYTQALGGEDSEAIALSCLFQCGIDHVVSECSDMYDSGHREAYPVEFSHSKTDQRNNGQQAVDRVFGSSIGEFRTNPRSQELWRFARELSAAVENNCSLVWCGAGIADLAESATKVLPQELGATLYAFMRSIEEIDVKSVFPTHSVTGEHCDRYSHSLKSAEYRRCVQIHASIAERGHLESKSLGRDISQSSEAIAARAGGIWKVARSRIGVCSFTKSILAATVGPAAAVLGGALIDALGIRDNERNAVAIYDIKPFLDNLEDQAWTRRIGPLVVDSIMEDMLKEFHEHSAFCEDFKAVCERLKSKLKE